MLKDANQNPQGEDLSITLGPPKERISDPPGFSLTPWDPLSPKGLSWNKPLQNHALITKGSTFPGVEEATPKNACLANSSWLPNSSYGKGSSTSRGSRCSFLNCINHDKLDKTSSLSLAKHTSLSTKVKEQYLPFRDHKKILIKFNEEKTSENKL